MTRYCWFFFLYFIFINISQSQNTIPSFRIEEPFYHFDIFADDFWGGRYHGDITNATIADTFDYFTNENIESILYEIQDDIDSLPLDDYLRRDGTVSPTGHFDWGDFNLTNVNNLIANGYMELVNPLSSADFYLDAAAGQPSRIFFQKGNTNLWQIMNNGNGSDQFIIYNNATGVLSFVIEQDNQIILRGSAPQGDDILTVNGDAYTLGEHTAYKMVLGNGETSWFSSALPALYRTSSTGSEWPFTLAGNLVIQPRTTLARDIIFNYSTGPLFRFNSTGAASIGGATNPATSLHIFHQTPILRIQDIDGDADAGTGYIEFYDKDSRMGYVGFGSASSHDMNFANQTGMNGGFQWLPNGNIRMRLWPSGQLVIDPTASNSNPQGGYDLTVRGSQYVSQLLQVENSITYGTSDKAGFDQYQVSVSMSSPVELKFKGHSLDTYTAYRVVLSTYGTGTLVGYVGVLRWDNNTTSWVIRDVSRSGSTSNHPYLLLDNGVVKIATNHASTYIISVTISAVMSNINNRVTVFGADGHWQRDVNTLYYQDGSVVVGSSTPQSGYELTVTGETYIENTTVATGKTIDFQNSAYPERVPKINFQIHTDNTFLTDVGDMGIVDP